MKDPFEAVRRACSPDLWSEGVRRARAGAVVEERRDEDEIVVRVAPVSGPAVRVSLYLDDGTWDCECGRHDGCAHVAAAVIAVRRADEGGTTLAPAVDSPARLVYRLRTAGDGLFFERGIEHGEAFEPIEGSLQAVVSGHHPGPRVMVTREDLRVEVALGPRRRGRLDRGTIPGVLAALARCSAVTLDGEPVRTSAAPVSARIRVEDRGDGFRVALADPKDVRVRIPDGAARVGDTLHPVRPAPLTARETEEFGRGRVFTAREVPLLVSEILPSLRERMPVDVETDRLPGTVVERPRVRIDLQPSEDGRSLVALATLVYGDPAVARVDAGHLVPLAEGPMPLRDPEGERRETRWLGERLGLAPGVPETFVGEAAVVFTRKLGRWSGEVEGEGRDRFAEAPPLAPRVVLDDDRFDVAFDVGPDPGSPSSTGRRGPAAEDVLRAWRAGERLVALPDGGWSPLPADWLRRFGDRIADLLAARRVAGELPRACLPDLAALCDALDRPRPPSFERLRAVAETFDDLPRVDLPDGLEAVLRPYQRTGADWLAFHRDAGLGALLADDMGLGKTVQVLSAVRGRTLVVAPTSVVQNWREEAARFRPSLAVDVYHGRGRELSDSADLTITSYALLRLDRERLAAVDWDTVVLDESQAIKNPESRVARAAFDLRAGFRVAMTGTPVENRLTELWSQFHFLARGLLGGLGDFEERYARPVASGDEAAAARLRARIRPFVLRRLKAEVAPELPPRTDVVLHAELDEEERRVYDAVRAATRDEVVRKLAEGGSVLAALEALLRLRQAACHRGLVPGQEAPGSSKVDVLLEALDNVVAEGHRALVFSQWTSFLDRIEPHLDRTGIGWTRLDGSTVDRAGVVARFQHEEGPPVLLVSLRAGGAGLNLTAADHVFLMDPWWNPAVEDQAADRAHRIGQDRPVLVYRVVAADTVEERILALQQHKRALADAATGGGVGAATLSRDELLTLLA